MASTNSTPVRLSPSVVLYNPPDKLHDVGVTHPKLVLIASWMDARDVHIAKYVARYQELFPSASILVTKSSFRHFLSPNTCRSETAPAVDAIRSIMSPEEDNDPRMIVHVFSNGGSCILYTLYELYRQAENGSLRMIGDNDHRLPRHATVFDSAPGDWTYHGSTTGVLSSIPAGWLRLLCFPVVHLLGVWWYIKYKILRVQEETDLWGSAHNDTGMVREACRSYMYSEADPLVNYIVVEEHADQAEARGFTVFRKENFKDSDHVAHAKKYPERYWNVIRDSWKTGLEDGEAERDAGPENDAP